MRDVFLTGATGFLGGELAVALSKINSIDHVYCLVRDKAGERAADRLESVFRFHGDDYDSNRIQPVSGDLNDPLLDERLKSNADIRGVDVIIHAGANTSFLPQKYSAVLGANLEGTIRLAKWAKTLRSLETFAYIGTATIAGAAERVRRRMIFEHESPDPAATHIVGYTESKLKAELKLREVFGEDQLLVIRPSIILGDTRPVVPRSFDIAWIIVAVQQLRMFFSNPDAACDIVPVDYAAEAILKLLICRERRHNTYHVSSGTAATTARKIIRSLGIGMEQDPGLVFCSAADLELLKDWLRGERLKPEPRLARYSDHLNYIENYIGRKKTRLLLAGLGPYWQFINLDQRFDNQRLLADTSISIPEPAHQYMQRVARFLDAFDPCEMAVNP